MPWKDKTVEEIRKEFVEAAKTSKNFSSLCREFGISRKTEYKWVERNNQSCSMSDRSHAPLHVPGRTSTEIEEAILRVRADNSEWGAKTILKVLENNGHTDLPCIVPPTISCKETAISAKRNPKSVKSSSAFKESIATNCGRPISKEISPCSTVHVAFHSIS